MEHEKFYWKNSTQTKDNQKKENITEWLISGNPKKYDCVNAFRDLKKIDLEQSTNVQEGDIVYLYVSGEDQHIRFRCRANKVDIKKREIDDSKYDVSGEFDGSYGRYMELEMIEEFDTELFSRLELEKHGFSSPQGPIRVSPELKEYLDVVQYIFKNGKLDPNKHDGSYELVSATINEYARMGDLSVVDYKDLNLVYLMCVGTWKQKIHSKKNTINDSNLPEESKQRLVKLLDEIWAKAQKGEYSNKEVDEVSVGMFGTGFFTFKGKTDNVSPRNFIKMCIDIKELSDENEIFDRCAKTLTKTFRGMKAASSSMVLHCLKPFVFPIFNSNMGLENIFVYFGVDMKHKTEIENYINNVRLVKEFRDKNFNERNYRVFDMAARQLGQSFKHTDIVEINKGDKLEEYKQKVVEDKIQNNKFDKNMILYGPPGTGKTYNTAIYAVAICDGKNLDEITDYDAVMTRYNELKKEGRISFTTFHQSYGYEEFIEGIKPVISNDENKNVEYEIADGIFKRFCHNAVKVENNKPYVFIIDEINRGNISKIFGELITLIEPTKRSGTSEEIEAILPYSNQSFSVPNNVYIIGTMNTADRSISIMDTALRRRFQFVEMMPDADVLRNIGADKIIDAGVELDVAKMLETINKRIEYLFDREHTIGHAFFTELKEDPSVTKLANIFRKSVIPLLQEYFYEDYNKIMLVLGDNGKEEKYRFINRRETKPNLIFRGDTSDIDIEDYSYEIQEKAFDDIHSYIEIIG